MPTSLPQITTSRLLLRPLEDEDAPYIFALRSSPEVNRYLDRKPATELSEAYDFIQKIKAYVTAGTSVFWVISNKEEGQFMGTITLWNMSSEKLVADIGYEMLPEYGGKGYTREAMAPVIRYGFDVLNLEQIEGCVVPQNAASVHLLQQYGFRLKEEIPPEVLYVLDRDGAIFS